MRWIESVPRDGTRQFRHILRYFAFPERVERISSNRERRRILEGFGLDRDALDEMGDVELDEKMAEVRARLEQEFPNTPIDFYEPPVRERWDHTAPPTALNDPPAPYVKTTGRHWWMTFNPTIFDIEAQPDGHRELFTTHNNRNNPRRIAAAFEQVQPGDLVIGYTTQPMQRAAVLCRITKGIHDSAEGRAIEFERVRALKAPVSRETMSADAALANAFPLPNPQGSLFPLTPDEFAAILRLAGETGPETTTPTAAPYSLDELLQEVFLPGEQVANILRQLRTKKNIVLQGPPGVGKTFVARRLAWLLMSAKDASRTECVQFHPSLSYEDFILGLRPDGNGHFTVKRGVFYRFCEEAKKRPEIPFVMIIDEINRGNVAKIFGELMLLIEPDKRGVAHAVSLPYAQETDPKFFLPSNLHLIGTMNTADRSLALVDYALRRRFAFFSIEPNFGPAFRAHMIETRGCTEGMVKRIQDRIGVLNREIIEDARSLGRGYQVGHSFFCSGEPIKEEEEWYRGVIEFEIKPLLEEYWMDDPARADAAVAKLLAG